MSYKSERVMKSQVNIRYRTWNVRWLLMWARESEGMQPRKRGQPELAGEVTRVSASEQQFKPVLAALVALPYFFVW